MQETYFHYRVDPIFTSASLASSEGILKVGETATYTASYTIEADAAATEVLKTVF